MADKVSGSSASIQVPRWALRFGYATLVSSLGLAAASVLLANKQRDPAISRTLHEHASQLTGVENTVRNDICELRSNLESTNHIIADLADKSRGELRAAVTELRAETHGATAEINTWTCTSAPNDA